MKWFKAFGALLVLVVLVVGPPALLIEFVGNPYPPLGISLTSPMSDDVIIGLLAVILWLLWAQMVVCIVIEAVNVVRAAVLDVRAPATFGVQQHLAQALVGAVVLALASGPVIGGGSQAAAAEARPNVASAPLSNVAETTTTTAADGRSGTTTTEGGSSTTDGSAVGAREAQDVTVQRGDTLWALAAHHLGAGERWDEIAALNEGHQMVDGRTFHASGSNIRPGWVLQMPVETNDVASTQTGGEEVTIERGDTLSQIALDELGDATAYPENFDASVGIEQPGGRHLSDPDHIEPGWTVRLPGRAAAPGAGASPAPEEGHDTGSSQEESDEQPPRSADVAPGPARERAQEPRGTSPGPTDTMAAGSRGAPVAVDAGQGDDGAGVGLPGWVMPGLTGAGALLAGSLLLALRRRRAAQHRTRRPGRVIAAVDPELATVDKSVAVAGGTTTTVVELVDDVLRRLAARLAKAGTPMPSLAAVEVTATTLAVHLKTATAAPAPWSCSDDRLLWVIDRDVDKESVGPDPGDGPAPWPLLVTIGRDDRNGDWLLNLEDLDVALTGDALAGADFARFVAAEVACNPWSQHTVVDLIGTATEVAAMRPERITVHQSPGQPAAEAVAEVVHTIDRLGDYDVTTPTARAWQQDPDLWPSRLLIADHRDAAQALAQLAGLMTNHGGRTATALVLHAGEAADKFEIHLDERRRLSIPAVGLSVEGVGLTAAEATGCASLLAQADTDSDTAAPDLSDEDGWRALVTATGSLREQYRLDRTHTGAASVLPDGDDAYEGVAATTATDLQALAPKVSAEVRGRVDEADPTLDADVEAWWSDRCARPRLSLLGPVTARTSGAALDRRKPFHTELLAYLLNRPSGATTDEVATAMDVSHARVRTDINTLRAWLGTDPQTGEPYLPDARTAPSAQARGGGVYEVVDALCDVDLFRRLRLRGQTRGAEGIADLTAALRLVTGRPFEQQRRAGWGWLFEGDRLDEQMVCAIADVAHLVVTHSLQSRDLERARAAVDVAALAGPEEEIWRLDLAALLDAQGHRDAAERIVREQVCNRSDAGQAPAELVERTNQIIEARRWLDQRAREAI